MAPEVNKVVATQKQQQMQKANNPQVPTTTSVEVGQGGINAALQERLTFLGIDYTTYMFYCEKNNNFAIMTKEEQLKHLEKELQTTQSATPVIEEMTETELAAHCAKIGATIEEYQHLCKYNEEFASYPIEKQKEIIDYARTNNTNILQLGVVDTEAEEEKKEELEKLLVEYAPLEKIIEEGINETIPTNTTTSETPIVEIVETEIITVEEEKEYLWDMFSDDTYKKVYNENGEFNFNKFSDLEWAEKHAVLANEIAKHDYELTKKEGAPTWEELPNEKRYELMDKANLHSFIITVKDFGDNKDLLDSYLMQKMEELQAIKWLGYNISFAEYEGYTIDKKEEIRHDYLASISFEDDRANNFTASQMNYSNKQYMYTQAVRQYAIDNGIETTLTDSHTEQMCEIFNLLNKVNETKPEEERKSFSKMFFEYLESQEKNGTITDSERKELDTIRQYMKLTSGNLVPKTDTNHLEQFNSSEAYRESWTTAKDINAKKTVIMSYILKQCKDKSANEKTQFIHELAAEIQHQPCPEGIKHSDFQLENQMLIQAIMEECSNQADNEEKDAIVNSKSNIWLTTLATNIKLMYDNDKIKRYVANIKKLENSENPEERELANSLLKHSMDDSGGKYGEYSDKAVTLGDAIYDNDIKSTEVRQSVADASVRFTHAKGQENIGLELANIVKNKGTVEDQIYLSDNIKNANVNSQLDLHNIMMDSKYAEVVEHTAGNIIDYDISVRKQALETVYEYAQKTGNQKPLETALENLIDNKKTHTIYQDAEFSNVIENLVVSRAKQDTELAELDLTKELTASVISSLSPEERKTYYINAFNKASNSERMQLLNKIPNGTQKKTIFTMIARFATNLMNNMVESGMGLMMLSANLPMDAENKILRKMISVANKEPEGEVAKQLTTLKEDKTYLERIEEFDKTNSNKELNTVRYENTSTTNRMSTPDDFIRVKFLGLTPKDIAEINKKGLFPHYNNGGFKA